MKMLCAATALAVAVALPGGAATLDEIAAAMGSSRLDNVQVSGEGKFFNVGQAFRAGGAWPEFRIVRYTRTDDYTGAALAYDITLQPAAGGPETRRAGGVKGDQPWVVTGTPFGAAGLQHELAIAPHGIVRAALADKVAVQGSSFAIARPGKFNARAMVNAQNLVEKVESWIPNHVLGDMAVVTTYADHKDFDGIKLPTKIAQTTGGHPSLELSIAEVKPNAGPVSPPAPSGGPAPPSQSSVKMERAADGVWFVTGPSHHSVAIEMADHVLAFEGPQHDERSAAVIAAIRDAVPNKPIRAVIASHHHFDHSGGLRGFAAEGIAIMLTEGAKPFFEQAYAAPRTLAPDRLSRSGRSASFQTFRGKHVFSDATRTFELHELAGNPHAEGLTVGYLPKEKILIVADAFSPRQPITQIPAQISPATANLWENLRRLNLEVDTVLPIHGRMVKVDELRMAAGVN
jgi:glyoxylase-like metal-dependent hydrolase (beta-lactamase superfamily II)